MEAVKACSLPEALEVVAGKLAHCTQPAPGSKSITPRSRFSIEVLFWPMSYWRAPELTSRPLKKALVA